MFQIFKVVGHEVLLLPALHAPLVSPLPDKLDRFSRLLKLYKITKNVTPQEPSSADSTPAMDEDVALFFLQVSDHSLYDFLVPFGDIRRRRHFYYRVLKKFHSIFLTSYCVLFHVCANTSDLKVTQQANDQVDALAGVDLHILGDVSSVLLSIAALLDPLTWALTQAKLGAALRIRL